MTTIKIIGIIAFLLIVLVLVKEIIKEWKTIKKKKHISLRKEQEYPLAFSRFQTPLHRTTGHSASMTLNKFTGSNGKLLNPEEYIGMIVCGSNFDGYGLFHGDLIFVKKNTTKDDLRPIKFIVVEKDGCYLIRQLYELTNSIAKIIDGAGDFDTIEEDKIVGIVEYDFNIK